MNNPPLWDTLTQDWTTYERAGTTKTEAHQAILLNTDDGHISPNM
jgi:hypothetical protein